MKRFGLILLMGVFTACFAGNALSANQMSREISSSLQQGNTQLLLSVDTMNPALYQVTTDEALNQSIQMTNTFLKQIIENQKSILTSLKRKN